MEILVVAPQLDLEGKHRRLLVLAFLLDLVDQVAGADALTCTMMVWDCRPACLRYLAQRNHEKRLIGTLFSIAVSPRPLGEVPQRRTRQLEVPLDKKCTVGEIRPVPEDLRAAEDSTAAFWRLQHISCLLDCSAS